jgi:peptidoglycan/LPS O-acetylase OafA/YrhL
MYGRSVYFGRFPNVGQLGVTLFCGISGYFAFRRSGTDTIEWLTKRLAKVMPAYWIALTGTLLLAAMSSYKSVSLRAVALQYAGLAAWLDDNERIGQGFWFITLILICYAIAAFVRKYPQGLLPIAIVIIGSQVRAGEWFAPHILSFLLCGWAVVGTTRTMLITTIPLVVAMTLWHNLQWLYPLSALGCLSLCLAVSHASPNWIAALGDISYEFYLVHGPVYLVLANMVHLPLFANLVFGSVLALMVGQLLRVITDKIVATWREPGWRHQRTLAKSMDQPS